MTPLLLVMVAAAGVTSIMGWTSKLAFWIITVVIYFALMVIINAGARRHNRPRRQVRDQGE